MLVKILQSTIAAIFGTALGKGILLVFAQYGFHPEDYVASMLGGMISSGAIHWLLAGVVGLIALACWELFQRRQINTLENPSCDFLPDISIDDAFLYLKPSLKNDVSESQFHPITKDVKDRLSLGEIKSWGRLERNAGQISAITEIPSEFWGGASLLPFKGQGVENGEEYAHFSFFTVHGENQQYNDIQLNFNQVKYIWGKSEYDEQ